MSLPVVVVLQNLQGRPHYQSPHSKLGLACVAAYAAAYVAAWRRTLVPMDLGKASKQAAPIIANRPPRCRGPGLVDEWVVGVGVMCMCAIIIHQLNFNWNCRLHRSLGKAAFLIAGTRARIPLSGAMAGQREGPG